MKYRLDSGTVYLLGCFSLPPPLSFLVELEFMVFIFSEITISIYVRFQSIYECIDGRVSSEINFSGQQFLLYSVSVMD
jgi:hypothetical protein